MSKNIRIKRHIVKAKISLNSYKEAHGPSVYGSEELCPPNVCSH